MPKLIAHLRPVTLFDIEGDETPSKRRLADAGERLMGTHGIDAPSLQEIAAAAGQANKFAVQYHFGGREGLIDAVFAIRMRHIVARRQECIRLAEERGLMDDLSSLLEAVFLPMSEQVDANGHHSYARLLLQYTTRIGFDPQRRDDPFNARRGLAVTLMERMAGLLNLTAEQFELGFAQQHFAMIVGLAARDNFVFRGRAALSLEELIDQTIAMAVPALEAAARFALQRR
ncbi:TetR/AcrR family transcriptional regulator [uncultured Sphingomonas sp.]|uniref:TetR/AcrR family transcriptional regulator n=1 Tax=uncultured Sphingomonas sp. TaxID=158754 RepID=UPI0025E51E94|nr:TetR/AcrR family transcriptional regulator [uncultured Sphingomonas sp.]